MTCQIWDWSVKATASNFLNKSADGINANAASPVITNGQACPAAVNGNVTTTDNFGNTFLTNAYEIINNPALNPTGNNDGLCESGEACIYAANMGAYQGSGDYTQATCTFTNGTVSGVTMYGYPVNGN